MQYFPALTELYCDDNNPTALDVSANSNIYTLSTDDTVNVVGWIPAPKPNWDEPRTTNPKDGDVLTLTEILRLGFALAFCDNLALLYGASLFPQADRRRPFRLGGLVLISMLLAVCLFFPFRNLVLAPLGALSLQPLGFAVFAFGVTGLLGILPKSAAVKPLLPLAGGNCAILALCLQSFGGSFFSALLSAFFGGAGTLLFLFLFSSVRDRIRFADPPKIFDGVPLDFITAGLIALVFLGIQ